MYIHELAYLESNLGQFSFNSADSRGKREIHKFVTAVHLESSLDGGINLAIYFQR